MTVRAATAVAFGEAVGDADGELARVRPGAGCVVAGCAASAAGGSVDAAGAPGASGAPEATGAAARLTVRASGKAVAKTDSVSSVLADAVGPLEVEAAEDIEAVAAVTTVVEAVAVPGTAAACVEEAGWES